MRSRTCFVAVCGVLFTLLLTVHLRVQLERVQAELIESQQHVHTLQERLRPLLMRTESCGNTSKETSRSTSLPGLEQPSLESLLPDGGSRPSDAHIQWDWYSMAKDMLQPFTVVTQVKLSCI